MVYLAFIPYYPESGTTQRHNPQVVAEIDGELLVLYTRLVYKLIKVQLNARLLKTEAGEQTFKNVTIRFVAACKYGVMSP